MKKSVSRYYCQYSGILIGFGLVFAFLLGIRTVPFWQQWLSNALALVAALGTASLFSIVAYAVFNRIQAFLFRFLEDTTMCSH
ncbi:hypothetical protein [Exiguobacterium himgiriensis]|uniref:hypothetical protein n=1 Tax=Exiguobacterium himgiriensis TaxID=384621 RepID=UPI0021AF8F04|nr:hypothetical protein [Exiguobacterium himgiriensis]MCT4784485.1 hypothetical protein [Exiguobacterium himgiriensis]